MRALSALLILTFMQAATAQVIHSKPRGAGPGTPPATDSAFAGTDAVQPGANTFRGMPVKRAPPGSQPPSQDPRDFAGVWISELVHEQTVPKVKPELAGKVQMPRASGFTTPNIESRKCHPAAYFQGTTAYPMQIVQTDSQVNFIFEENRRMRRIYIDGKLPKNPVPAHFGHSVGHWEADTLVVETIGLKHTLDYQLTATPDIRVVERMRKVDGGTTLDIQVTYYNDKEWATPGAMHVRYQWRPDLSLLEVICEEFSDAFGRGYDTLR